MNMDMDMGMDMDMDMGMGMDMDMGMDMGAMGLQWGATRKDGPMGQHYVYMGLHGPS